MSPDEFSEAWLAPPDVRALLEAYRGKRTFFRGPDARRLAALTALRKWEALDILAGRTRDVCAWFETRDGVLTAAEVSPDVARKLYRAGMTFYAKAMAEVDPVRDAVARLWRLPPANVVCDVFCNHPGAKSRAHFDAANLITVQITGRKRWRIAPNRHAPDPNSGWAVNDRVMARELRLYARGPMPERMPDDAEEFVLEPGAMLYMPRGFWHETESDRESVSLHVSQAILPWADAVLPALRAKLVRDPAFRADASAIWDASRRPDAEAVLASLLGTLVAHAADLAPDDVLPTPRPREGAPGPDDQFTRRAAASFLVEARPSGADAGRVTFAVVEQGGPERRATVEMSASYLRACELFVGPSPPPLSARAIAARVPGLEVGEALALLSLLLEVGFLRPAS
ncbi:MAG TPA: cupin domain-containing protein [Polyangiaceae bacterium]|nr:cupin domain-containing protein [Polyangiaceae bacterium]